MSQGRKLTGASSSTTAMNCKWFLWSTSFCERFRNRPYCLIDTWRFSTLFPIFEILFSRPSPYFEWHSLLPFCRLCSWFIAIILWAPLYASVNTKALFSCFRSKMLVLQVDSLYTETIRLQIMCCFTSLIRRANLDTLRYMSSNRSLETYPSLSVFQLDLKPPSF
jgi:hypothetical protein